MNDAPNVIVDHSKEKYCPLCGKPWIVYEEEGQFGRVFLVCVHCMISIWIRDKLLGRWDILEKVPCGMCGKDMRMFARAADGFMALKCPDKKCGLDIRTDDPDYTRVIKGQAKTQAELVDKPFNPEFKINNDEA